MDLEKLVEEFAENVAAQSESIMRGDAKMGNKHADRYIAALRKLRSAGDPGRDALAVLLKHPRQDVRVKAAAFLLRYRTAEAKAVLEAAADRTGISSIGAIMTLKYWQEGTWNLDPVDEASGPFASPTRQAPTTQRARPKARQVRRRGGPKGDTSSD
ncbi:DUF2019 domain-containing protein [Archangium sp.]|uniref:DUF2019 domain-containing protein n=1 Tax=Archangium sp. TaxID=1872627 RepID=UPI00389A55DD